MDLDSARIALIGEKGMLAQAVKAALPESSVCRGYDLPDFDLTDRGQVLGVLSEFRPSVIINCAAYTDVDGCEEAEGLATQVNGAGPGYLAEAAASCGARLVHISTDYVFDGQGHRPYLEGDPVSPVSAYGRSKLAGEQAIASSGCAEALIVRTSWLYGPGGRNFVETMLRLMNEREQLGVVADQVGSPTLTNDLATAIVHLLCVDARGIVHFSNSGVCSWHQFAQAIRDLAVADGMDLKVKQVNPVATEDFPLPARRPAYSVLDKARYVNLTGDQPPEWKASLGRYLRMRKTA